MSTSTFRFKFSEAFVEEINSFAKINQYTDRMEYKENWERWVKSNEEIINQETETLASKGYQGDILEKAYKSGRYYFRNKKNEEKKEKERRKYINIDREIIDLMDEFIELNKGSKPSILFEQFCIEHTERLDDEEERLTEEGIEEEIITGKFKKTFKNRYFLQTQKT